MDDMGITRILNSMTLDQKIGQLGIAGICGGEDLDFARRNFEAFHFGGLMFSPLFQTFIRSSNFYPCGVSRNVSSVETSQFLHAIKNISKEVDGIPCFIGGDQEGGMSGSFLRRNTMTILPKPMGISHSPHPHEDAYEAAAIAAREVKAMGYDMLFGPVLDISINPDNPEVGTRSFGDDPQLCAELGVQFIKAYRDEGIIGVSKHFPGRGRGAIDAHFALERLAVSKEEMLRYDLVPFVRAIEAGTEAVMVCHTIFSSIDPKFPASLSKPVVTGLLRNELGFDGLVIPDTLTMWAILKNFDVPRACSMVLEAGCDMFFMKDPPRYKAAIRSIKDSIQRGSLTEEAIEEKVKKVLALKMKYGLFDKSFSEETLLNTIGAGNHVKSAKRLAENSIVLIKNQYGTLPVEDCSCKRVLVIVPREVSIIQANDAKRDHLMLPRALEGVFREVHHVVVDQRATEDQLFEIAARSRNADIVIAGVFMSGWNKGLASAVELVLDTDRRVIILLACNPREMIKIPGKIDAALCTFCAGPQQFEVFAESLNGTITLPRLMSNG